MRFMMLVKANEDSGAGVPPTKEDVADMGKYTEELAKAGVLLAAEGLHSSAKGARVAFEDGKHTVIDGPFTESKELIAGFWLIQVRSREEAIQWATRVPGMDGSAIEVRQVFEVTDFPPEVMSQDDVAREQELRDGLASR